MPNEKPPDDLHDYLKMDEDELDRQISVLSYYKAHRDGLLNFSDLEMREKIIMALYKQRQAEHNTRLCKDIVLTLLGEYQPPVEKPVRKTKVAK